ncbi:unnamed protein product [Lasius platythorax]|uniref:Uncharacterized protein n=1 Tax=Lasius platythorax TaxID=488582 RepID=A0AAV2NQ01_9HYME
MRRRWSLSAQKGSIKKNKTFDLRVDVAGRRGEKLRGRPRGCILVPIAAPEIATSSTTCTPDVFRSSLLLALFRSILASESVSETRTRRALDTGAFLRGVREENCSSLLASSIVDVVVVVVVVAARSLVVVEAAVW